MSQKKVKRARRVELAVPGSNEKMMEKAVASAADLVFLDLEDAVAPNSKVASRAKVIAALKELDWSGKTSCVRINDLTTEWAYEDIIAVMEAAHDRLDVIMVPKVLCASDVLFVDTLLTQIERKLKTQKRVAIEVLIEEVEAMVNVEEIAKSSSRLEAMIFGLGDYSASQGMDLNKVYGPNGYPGDVWHYGRFKMTIAARAAGIDAVDGPFADFRDNVTYAEECRRASLLGMVGKWAIHPSQISVALDAFTPDKAAVTAARDMVSAYTKAKQEGLGAVNYNGILIDEASVRSVRNILEKAEIYRI
jgi:citrate lyase subunit beta / citryl-CoA lyase